MSAAAICPADRRISLSIIEAASDRAAGAMAFSFGVYCEMDRDEPSRSSFVPEDVWAQHSVEIYGDFRREVRR